ncbi:MAG: lipopolysaccharide biosynthesis protein [Staphylococcus equorum]|nr:lipopolysaccharide biosynthesis protein [Staphylococcus equorum]
MLLTMAVSLYTSRVVLATLGVEDYGIYNVVGGIVAMFGFLNSSMAGATQRFLTFELGKGNLDRLKKVFSTSIHIHFIIALIVVLLAETIGLWFLYNKMIIPVERMDAAFWVFQFSVLSAVVLFISIPYNAVIIAHERMSAFAYISIIDVVLKLLIVYLLSLTSYDRLIFYAFLLLIVQVLIRITYGIYCKRHFIETAYRFVWDKMLFKEMANFATWQLFGNLAAVSYTQGVNILLNMFFGPAVNAARAIAVQVQSAIQQFTANFQQALNPQITKNYAINDLKRMHTLIFASARYSFFLLFFLSLPVLLETEIILSLWLKEVPEHTVNFIRIILVISMIDVMSNPLITAAGATGRIKVYQITVGGVLLLILPFSYGVLKMGGIPEFVFLVHLFFVCVAQVVRLGLIRSMISLSLRKFFKEVVVRAFMVTCLSSIIPLLSFLLLEQTLSTFFLVCVLSVLSVSITVFFVGLLPNERQLVLLKINQWIKIKKS